MKIQNQALLAQIANIEDGGLLGRFLVPGLIICIVVALLFIVMVVASRYKRVPPNAIGVFYGRKYAFKSPDGAVGHRGFMVLTGGGRILLPIVEQYQVMSTAAFQVAVAEKNIPSAKNVGVNVQGVATCRVSSIPDDQANAVQAFLGKTDEEIQEFISQILKGHIRSIVGKMEVDDLLRNRAKFNQQVVEESQEEFRRLGIQIITLVIQDIGDNHGYIEALGRQAIAETLRDANIKVAEADKETAVKTSIAQREAAEAKSQNEALMAAAERDKNLKVAGFQIETEAKRAEAETAFGIAQAQQMQKQKVAEAERDAAAAEAGVAVQAKEALRREKELEATVLTQAAADQKKAIIKAESDKAVALLEAERAKLAAEGVKNAAVLEGEGEARRKLTLAEAEATAIQKTASAQAEGQKAKFLAEAEGKKAQLLAEANGEEAKLLAVAKGKQAALEAEAKGTSDLAAALQQLSEQGKLILILDRLPTLIEKTGTAGEGIAEKIFGSVAKSLEKMGPITITDLGGGATANGAIGNVANMVPSMVVNVLSQLAGRGVDLQGFLSKLGIDSSALKGLIPSPSATTADAGASATEK